MAEDTYNSGARPGSFDRTAAASHSHPPPPAQYHHLPPPRPSSRGASRQPPPPSYASPSAPHPERNLPPATYPHYTSPYPASVNHSPGYPHDRQPPVSPGSSSPPGSATTVGYTKSMPVSKEQDMHRNSVDAGPYMAYPAHEFGPPPGHPAAMQHDPTAGYAPMHQPGSAGGYPGPYGYDPYSGPDGQLRKKAARATQACDQCRKKKAKCDEARPSCLNCRQNGLQCNYAQSAPPKQDRTLFQMSEQLQAVFEGFQSFKQEIRNELKNFRDQHHTAPGTPSVATTPIERPIQASFQFDAQPDRSLYQWKGEDGSDVMSFPHQPENGFLHHVAVGSHLPLQHANEERTVDMLGGQASIPPEHTTAAHKLVSWETIAPFYEGITDPDYVRREELARVPLLQVAGRRRMPPKLDRHAIAQTSESPAANSDRDDTSTHSTSESRRSAHLNTIPYVGGSQIWPRSAEDIGDRETGRRLLGSYLERMHVMHPFLHAGFITDLVEQFFAVQLNTQQHPPEPGHLSRVDSASDTASLTRNHKRKRSEDGNHSSPADSAQTVGRRLTTETIDPTIENALVCLVFALGKICEHHSSLAPYFTPLEQIGAGANPLPASVDRSHSLKSPSPGTPLPGSRFDTSKYHAGRSPNSGTVAADGYAFEPKDVDQIPGMGFYRRAAAIMGELRGGNELQDIQACLLAGLYMAQLVRVRESWDWINEACQKCALLLERTDFSKHGRQPKDSIRMVYWTCIQFESDLLAELDFLPNSHLSRFSEQIRLPNGQDCEKEDRASELTMIYYSAQARLRQILDRIHSALYNVSHIKSGSVGWSHATAEDLLQQLDSWKSVLPPILQWDDEHPTPAKEINTCRLRAKYYGARYVALRPFFQTYIHQQVQKHGSRGVPPPSEASDEVTSETRNLLTQSLKCAKAAIQSTVVFDDVETMYDRLMVTNIWGTAHAQFGNMLVLAAANSHGLRWLVSDAKLDELLDRTLTFLRNLAPLSPTMYTDYKVLENTKRIVLASRPSAESMQTSFSN